MIRSISKNQPARPGRNPSNSPVLAVAIHILFGPFLASAQQPAPNGEARLDWGSPTGAISFSDKEAKGIRMHEIAVKLSADPVLTFRPSAGIYALKVELPQDAAGKPIKKIASKDLLRWLIRERQKRLRYLYFPSKRVVYLYRPDLDSAETKVPLASSIQDIFGEALEAAVIRDDGTAGFWKESDDHQVILVTGPPLLTAEARNIAKELNELTFPAQSIPQNGFRFMDETVQGKKGESLDRILKRLTDEKVARGSNNKPFTFGKSERLKISMVDIPPPGKAGEFFSQLIDKNGLERAVNTKTREVIIYEEKSETVDMPVLNVLKFLIREAIDETAKEFLDGDSLTPKVTYKDGKTRIAGLSFFIKTAKIKAEAVRNKLPRPMIFDLKFASATGQKLNLGTTIGAQDGNAIGELRTKGVVDQLKILLPDLKDDIYADPRRNAVVIVEGYDSDKEKKYAKLISKLDRRPEMVEITAAIVDISVSTEFDWRSEFAGIMLDGNNTYLGGFGALKPGFHESEDGILPPEGLADGIGLNAVTQIIGSNYRVISRIKALEGKGRAQLHTQPSILTLDNFPARIVDTVTAYVSVAGERDANLFPVQSGLEMVVLPRVVEKFKEEGDTVWTPVTVRANGQDETIPAPLARKKGDPRHVHLLIDISDGDVQRAEQAKKDESPPQAALTADNRVATQAILKEGESLLIGGRYINDVNNAVSQIPIIGRIPVLGLAFKNKNVIDGRFQRLYLITPRIIDIDGQTEAVPPGESHYGEDVARAYADSKVTPPVEHAPRAIPLTPEQQKALSDFDLIPKTVPPKVAPPRRRLLGRIFRAQ